MTTPAPAPFCGVPAPNPLFVGRRAELRELARLLTLERATVVVCGTGGLGKSQLAGQYAAGTWRAGRYPGGVFWLVMDNPDGIATQVANLAGPDALDLPGWDPGQAAQNQQAVQRAWQQPVARLLVFDNCEDPALLARWRPQKGGCRVLVTSRNSEWPAALGGEILPLETLPRPDSHSVLLTPRAKKQRRTATDLLADPATQRDADALADWLGDLPLALALAAAYLETAPGVTLAAYLAALQQTSIDHPSLNLSPAQDAIIGHHAGLRATFLYSYDRLNETNTTDALALTLLHRAAQCAPGVPIPRRLLVRAAELDPDQAAATAEADGALHRLGSLGLLASEPDGSLLLHRLLAAYARARADAPATDQAAVKRALVDEILPLNTNGNPLPAAPYLDHLRHAAQVDADRDDMALSLLLNELGLLLYYRGEYVASRPLHERALAIRERERGPTHPTTATSLNNLALLLNAQGNYATARPLYERALAIREQALGPTHPDTARSLSNLAGLLWVQGDYAAARPLYERALAINEAALGPTHPATSTSLNNLAALLEDLGDRVAARPLYERALAIREQVLGPTHPDTATSLNNLAGLLRVQKDYAAAQPLYERALAIDEAALGPYHPNVASDLNNLAVLLEEQGDTAASMPLKERALAIHEQVLGPTHPLTAASLNNLAFLLYAQGAYGAARPLLERALAIRDQALGPTHPLTAASLNNLAFLLKAQGDYAAARPLYERAVAICERALGPDHPDTRLYRANLAGLLAAMGEERR